MSIVGKFFFHCGKEHIHAGQIVEQVSDDVVLVKFDSIINDDFSPMAAFSISSFATKIGPDGCPEPGWEFFATREQLDSYLEWLDEPSDGEKPDAKSATIN